jgi:hypothetical protein
MAVIEILGVVLGLAVIALMALTPTLVALNDRFPPGSRETTAETRPAREGQGSSVRTNLLGHHTPAHR